MIAYLLASALSCDPALTALFTPLHSILGHYEVCTTADPLDRVAAPAPDSPQYAPSEMLEPSEAFGAAGPYNRALLARLYAGKRVRVARGWIARADRFESVTLLSPYPDATLTRLQPGTMMITWTLPR